MSEPTLSSSNSKAFLFLHLEHRCLSHGGLGKSCLDFPCALECHSSLHPSAPFSNATYLSVEGWSLAHFFPPSSSGCYSSFNFHSIFTPSMKRSSLHRLDQLPLSFTSLSCTYLTSILTSLSMIISLTAISLLQRPVRRYRTHACFAPYPTVMPELLQMLIKS